MAMSDLLDGVWEFANDPFFLAVFSAVVLTGLTHRWADRKESVQLRTELVSAMSETASNAFLAGDRVFGESARVAAKNAAAEAKHRKELQPAAETWEKDNAVIGTRLEAYFPTGAGELDTVPESCSGADLTSHAVEAADKDPIPIAWHWLGRALLCWLEDQREDDAEWVPEQSSLKKAKAKLIRRVLAEPIEVFKDEWFPWYRWFPRRRATQP
jgi:hypothetical protein